MTDATCSVEGCDRPSRARGWCARHYQRWKLKGDPGPAGLQRAADGTACIVDGCGNPNSARGYCEMHRWRVRQYGEPGEPGKKQKRRRKPPEICIVPGCGQPTRTERYYGARGMCRLHYERQRRLGDPGPPERLAQPRGSGHVDPKGYRRINVAGGRRVMEHVYVMEQQLGRQLRPGESVHHKHGLRDHNDPANLELWVSMQPRGQRVEDLVVFVAENYPEMLEARGWIRPA